MEDLEPVRYATKGRVVPLVLAPPPPPPDVEAPALRLALDDARLTVARLLSRIADLEADGTAERERASRIAATMAKALDEAREARVTRQAAIDNAADLIRSREDGIWLATAPLKEEVARLTAKVEDLKVQKRDTDLKLQRVAAVLTPEQLRAAGY